jgi:Flp pilus assembly protein TadG
MCVLKSTKGTSTILTVFAITIVLGITAFVLDFGVVVLEKTRLAHATDAAALAGARELILGVDDVQNEALYYLNQNQEDLQGTQVDILDEDRQVWVSAEKEVHYLFAKVLGYETKSLHSISKARVENIVALSGVRPIAVVQQTFTYGKVYTLKEGGGDGYHGNYAPISLGGTGSNVYKDNFMNGYNGVIRVGDIIYTETGNMAGGTKTSVQYLLNQSAETYDHFTVNCPKVLFVPVVNTLEVNGKKAVEVLGFATFFLEGFSESQGGQVDVTGRFISYCMDGETSTGISDFGTYGVRLVR